MSDFTVQELTLGQLLENTAARFPDTDAVIHADRELRQTWSEFSACVDDMARGLMAIGVQKGRRLPYGRPTCLLGDLMFATARIRAILVGKHQLPRNRVRYLLQQSECENLFIIDSVRDHDFIASTYEVLPELRRQRRGMLEVEGCRTWKRVFSGNGQAPGHVPSPELFSLAEMSRMRIRKAARSFPYDVVNMQYSPGRRAPKGRDADAREHRPTTAIGSATIRNFPRATGYACRAFVPLLRLRARGHGLREPRGHHGAARRLLPRAGDDRRGAGEVHRPVRRADHVPGHFGSPRLLAFRFFLAAYGDLAGSVCPEPLMRRVMDQMCMSEITICYGLTEGSPVMTQTRTDDTVERRVKTVGRSMPGIEVTIRDPETNEEVPRNAVGEVCCRGYNVMQGYYNMPKDTAEAIDEEGWLHSGDLGIMDEDGYVSISGRIKDMIIRGGENVYPREVEEFLLKMDGVADAGRPCRAAATAKRWARS